jgi:hypothetical protein
VVVTLRPSGDVFAGGGCRPTKWGALLLKKPPVIGRMLIPEIPLSVKNIAFFETLGRFSPGGP